MQKRGIRLLLLLVVALGLGGCNRSAAAEPSVTPTPAQSVENKIVAEMVMTPAHHVTLRTESGGIVTELVVAVGERVEAGDVLVRLDPADAALAVQQAEAALALAQARLALAQSGPRAEDITLLKAQFEAAEAMVAQAAARRDAQASGLQAADALGAQAEVAAAQAAHRQANEDHDDTMKCFDYTLPDGSEETVCPALGTFEELARAEMEATQAALVAAQAQLAALEGEATPQVRAAQAATHAALAQRDAAQSHLDLAKGGNAPEEIALAEAAVQQAAAALARAEAQLTSSAIKAPFAGTVTALPSKVGDVAAVGDALASVATLDRLEVRTIDLSELDVVHVAAGQQVTVKLDARSDVALAGRVLRIEAQGVEHFEDVTYPVVIKLDAPPPPWMRWGMRGQVEIVWED